MTACMMDGLPRHRPPGRRATSLVRRIAVRAALLTLAVLVASAAPAGAETPRETADAATRTVYVINNNWHTSIVLRRDDPALRELVPEAEDYPDATYLEFGWGDSEYYPAESPSMRMALGAALRPTDTVMHVTGLTRPPHLYYPEDEVVALALPAATVDRLVAAIDGTFDRSGAARASVVARSRGRNDGFYPAHGRFHMFNTCNSWTVRMLAEAGLSVSTTGVMTARQAMRRIRGLPEAAPVRR